MREGKMIMYKLEFLWDGKCIIRYYSTVGKATAQASVFMDELTAVWPPKSSFHSVTPIEKIIDPPNTTLKEWEEIRFVGKEDTEIDSIKNYVNATIANIEKFESRQKKKQFISEGGFSF